MKAKHLNQLVQNLSQGYLEQLAKYKEILKMAQLQSEAIAEMDLEKTKGILARRQDLMNEIDQMNAALLPVKEEIKQILHFKDITVTNIKIVHTPAAQIFQETIEKLGDVLRQISDIDTKNEEALVQKMGQNQAERLRLNNSLKAQKAYYQGKSPAQPEFFDRKK